MDIGPSQYPNKLRRSVITNRIPTMNSSTLSTVTHSVIDSYGHAVLNCIAAVNGGSLRMLERAHTGWQSSVARRGARLSEGLRGDLTSAGSEFIGYVARGSQRTGERAAGLVKSAVQLASSTLDATSTRARRIEDALGTSVLPVLAPIAMPAVRASFDFAQLLVTESGKVVSRVAAPAALVDSSQPSRKASAKRTRRAAG
jgi:hypothetical protein